MTCILNHVFTKVFFVFCYFLYFVQVFIVFSIMLFSQDTQIHDTSLQSFDESSVMKSRDFTEYSDGLINHANSGA